MTKIQVTRDGVQKAIELKSGTTEEVAALIRHPELHDEMKALLARRKTKPAHELAARLNQLNPGLNVVVADEKTTCEACGSVVPGATCAPYKHLAAPAAPAVAPAVAVAGVADTLQRQLAAQVEALQAQLAQLAGVAPAAPMAVAPAVAGVAPAALAPPYNGVVGDQRDSNGQKWYNKNGRLISEKARARNHANSIGNVAKREAKANAKAAGPIHTGPEDAGYDYAATQAPSAAVAAATPEQMVEYVVTHVESGE